MNANAPKFFIVAGEQSGDLHGSMLMQAIKKFEPSASFVGHGGDRMVSSGLDIMYHVNKLGIMGFTEVIKHLPFMINVMGESLEKIKELRPNRVILIDYPGFNLRLAKNCRPHAVPVTYFILPQLWAWKENRIQYFHNYIDQSLSIFPFEQDWFESREVPTNYVGHPFSEGLEPGLSKSEFYKKHSLDTKDVLLALIPGSRQQEIDKHLQLYCDVANKIKKKIERLKVIVTKASGVSFSLSDDFLIESEDIYGAMKYSKAAITTSGTASLECAMLDTPEVVCYRLSTTSYAISKLLNKSPFISMVNLIANKKIVPELLQRSANVNNILNNILPLLSNTDKRKTMLSGMSQVRRSIGMPGVYERAAQAIINRT